MAQDDNLVHELREKIARLEKRIIELEEEKRRVASAGMKAITATFRSR